MATSKPIAPLDRFLDRVLETMTPQEIMAFAPTDEEQRRADELTDKNKGGKLSADEADELAQLMQFNNLVTLLKIKAYKALNAK